MIYAWQKKGDQSSLKSLKSFLPEIIKIKSNIQRLNVKKHVFYRIIFQGVLGEAPERKFTNQSIC